MAGSKEIRMKIKSVQNTRKITKAMEMVAASKMRKAQERMKMARPYGEKIRNVVSHMASAHTEYRHPLMVSQNIVKKIGVVVITSDKGLCGGLNTNVLRLLTQNMKKWEQDGHRICSVAIGNKGLGFLTRIGVPVEAQTINLGDVPHLEKLIGPLKVLLDQYQAGEIDSIYIAFNQFVNTMKQVPVVEKLVPIEAIADKTVTHSWDYIYEPDPQKVIDELMIRYVEALLYQAVAENIACEQSARMVAMKAASDNAKTVIGELQLVYNKSRQAMITKELSEIVGGAAAV